MSQPPISGAALHGLGLLRTFCNEAFAKLKYFYFQSS